MADAAVHGHDEHGHPGFFVRWFMSTNHKDIGILYLFTSAIVGFIAVGSNELGEFESGVAARFLGPVGAAVFGGIGTMIVTGTWAWAFPALRKADRLDGPPPDTETSQHQSLTAAASN